LIVRVTATSGADHSLPSWPVALQGGSNACGQGQTAAWRARDSSFDASVAFGDGVTDADRQAIDEAFSSLRFDDDARWFPITGFDASDRAAPIQVLDGGFLHGTPWLHVAYPERQGTWLCSGTMYPWDAPHDSADAAGEPPDASCGKAPGRDDLLLNSDQGCTAIGKQEFLTELSGSADASVASIVIEMDDGDRWATTPVAPPPGADLGGRRLWVAPALTGVTGVATAYNDAGQQQGDPLRVDACKMFAEG
jgi:hypothetical protein